MTDAKPPRPPTDFPEACIKVPRGTPVGFRQAAVILRTWRKKHPNAVQLDGHPDGRNNLKPWLHIKLEGFTSPQHDFQTKHSQEVIPGCFYNGIWNFHGDAKATAIDRMLALADAGGSPTEFLIPSATYETKPEHIGPQNPKLTLPDGGGVDGFYLYLTASKAT